jgi:hypothetical protein
LLDVVKDISPDLGSVSVVLSNHPLAVEYAKKLAAAALSAQLPTALMLQVT